MVPASTRFVHVANGTSTTATIHQARVPGTSSIWADVLHEGPVPGGMSDDELLRVRARHLADDVQPSYDDIVAEMIRWRAVLDDDATRDELILWYEHDLFDQLNLIQVLSRLAGAPGRTHASKPVSLICIGSFPGRPQFKGLGELTPDELASLFETRQRVTDAQYALAERAWTAFRAPDPRALEGLLRSDTSALPFLATALQRHLEEFPWTTDGLSRTERRLMSLAQAGPIDLRTAFSRMHEDETAFYVADASFLQIARELAATSPPLVTLDPASGPSGAASEAGPQSTHPRLGRASIALTDTGRAVLTRGRDRVALCGFDRWLGGVHLQATSSAPTWRWDPSHARLVFA